MPPDWEPRARCCTAEPIDILAPVAPEVSNWERAQREAEERRRRVGPGNRHERRRGAALRR
jgi:hypothetical protein